MGIFTIFSRLKEVEAATGKLYSMINVKTAGSYPEISALFKKLADEEIMHEKKVEMYKNFFMEANELFLGTEDAEQILEQVLNKIETFKRYFLENMETITPGRLVKMAADLEWEMENRHHTFYVNSNDEGIKNLMESLSVGDETHIKFINFLSKKYKK